MLTYVGSYLQQSCIEDKDVFLPRMLMEETWRDRNVSLMTKYRQKLDLDEVCLTQTNASIDITEMRSSRANDLTERKVTSGRKTPFGLVIFLIIAMVYGSLKYHFMVSSPCTFSK